VVVRRTSFAGNGTKPSAAGRAWGCCAGALSLVHSIAAVEDSTFVGNGSAGFGGAISAVASRLSIARSLFEQNSARVGGAVMFWGKAARTNVWSTGSLPGPLSLTLNRVRFRTNTATELGGAVAWSGEMGGDSALFANNSARQGGGLAHWSLSGSLDADFADVFPTLVAQTQPGPETLALSRGVFLDNTAVEQGAAFASGDATVRLGNLLAVRNTVTKASAAASALHGADITLINATVVDNGSTGVALAAPLRALALINSIVAGNAGGNCVAPANKLTLNAANIQYPGNTCGSAASRAPALDKDYAPSLLSPARVGGEMSRCLGPLVGGRDLHGASRGSTGACSIGAIEPDLQRDLFKNTPLERGGARWWWFLLWLLLILILLLGIIIGRKRARARRRAKAR
jgi:predicted outer membrane repeat protein